MDGLRAVLTPGPVADTEPARLEVRRVGRRRDLPVALLMREPGFDVVLLRRRVAAVARGDVDDAVGEAELPHELLLDCEQPVVLVPRRLRLAEHEQLDLV